MLKRVNAWLAKVGFHPMRGEELERSEVLSSEKKLQRLEV
jgi:hypothetical protein